MVEQMNVSVPLAELPEDVRQRLSREALRRGVHVKQVLKEWILEMARRMVDSATLEVLDRASGSATQPKPEGVAA